MVKNCELESVISYGSEGTVYSGTWRGTLAAIKVLSNQYARRVENERKLVRSLDHINIIKYYDLEYEQGTAYLAMEFITGGNLYSFIQSNFNSSSYWITVDQVLQDIAEGIMYLHDRHIIQGDLKSHNILLRERTHQAVICDFGISRSLDNDNQEKKQMNTTKGKSIELYHLF
jgi:serine/threonine protein kinase